MAESATAATTTTTTTAAAAPHSLTVLPCVHVNRAFAAVYGAAVLLLVYSHARTLLHSPTFLSLSLSASLFLADLVLAFMWATTQSFRIRPVTRRTVPENLRWGDFPAMDVFICTADPYKEPPIGVANTALSVMAYDYPPEKMSVYVSDDGGSELTLLAFVEAAKFAAHWLPFCRENDIMDRCPAVLFGSNYALGPEAEKIKTMYESMKMKVESAVERGKVSGEDVAGERERQIFGQWNEGFTRHDHPSVIQVLLESAKDRDESGKPLPNLIYVSREKSKATPHHFKAGALNTLLRVSAVMTNAPVVLTQDCDMYSNDPTTPHQMLCFYSDPSLRLRLGYIQFPQRFHGLNRADSYAGEYKRLYVINPAGMDGLLGPCYVGSGCFFNRRAFFGGPSSFVAPEIEEIGPNHVVVRPVKDFRVLALAHRVARCDFEHRTNWGSKMGFRYGSLSEDFHTGLHQHCEGWRSIFCNPERPAFLGDMPITLHDLLNQNRRWCVGLLEVVFSRHNPLSFGARFMGPLMALAYAHNAFWPIWSFPIIVYAFLPQLALLNKLPIFPEVTDARFLLHVFLFLGAYGQDCFDFMYYGGSFRQWWNDQRIWLIKGLTSYLFGSIEFAMKRSGIASKGFNVTSKLVDDEQSKRYERGVFEFGVASPMFVPLTTAAIVNLVAFSFGLLSLANREDSERMFGQMFVAGFAVLNSLPIYEAMVFRSDKGKMPAEICVLSSLLACALFVMAYLLPKL